MSEQLYHPPPGERQLTLRAVLAGCLLGSLIVAMNLYLGFRIGLTTPGSLIAALLGFGFFRIFRPRGDFGVLEANITQTAGSGAGAMVSAAGLVGPIPALLMLQREIPIWGLFLWGLATAYLGVMLAVPLRRQCVVVEKLRFPDGTATASAIVALFARVGEGVIRAKLLLACAVGAFAFTLLSFWWPSLGLGFWPRLDQVPLDLWLGGIFVVGAEWGFRLYLAPAFFGAGMLMGPRIGASLLLGAVSGWAVLGPVAHAQGWAPALPSEYFKDGEWGARGWILWPGVAVIFADAMTSLLLKWRVFVAAFRRPATATKSETSPPVDFIPTSWWVTGLAVAAAGTCSIAYAVFDIPLYLSALAVVLSAALANVAVRSVGETNINPIGPMGKLTQLAYGGLTSSLTTNLLAAGITGAGASQAGDMMQDLKTGYLLGASPRQQFKAQLCGVTAGVACAIPIFYLFQSAYEIGDPNSPLPAPTAHAWKATAEVLSHGLGVLPPNAEWAALVGLGFGAFLPLLRRFFPALAPFTPSGLAFGMAFLAPPSFSVAVFVGSLLYVLWRRRNRDQCGRFLFPLASGLIVGEGLGGVASAGLKLASEPVAKWLGW